VGVVTIQRIYAPGGGEFDGSAGKPRISQNWKVEDLGELNDNAGSTDDLLFFETPAVGERIDEAELELGEGGLPVQGNRWQVDG
jgi:hypothetical protein